MPVWVCLFSVWSNLGPNQSWQCSFNPTCGIAIIILFFQLFHCKRNATYHAHCWKYLYQKQIITEIIYTDVLQSKVSNRSGCVHHFANVIQEQGKQLFTCYAPIIISDNCVTIYLLLSLHFFFNGKSNHVHSGVFPQGIRWDSGAHAGVDIKLCPKTIHWLFLGQD